MQELHNHYLKEVIITTSLHVDLIKTIFIAYICLRIEHLTTKFPFFYTDEYAVNHEYIMIMCLEIDWPELNINCKHVDSLFTFQKY